MAVKTSKDYAKDYTHPQLREKLKEEIKQGDKGGRPGQWSARKSQLLVREYEKQGGGYKHSGERTAAQKSLKQWSEEDWQTADQTVAIKDDKTVRYLPREVWEQLSEKEKELTNQLKVSGSRKGAQHIDNPAKVKKILYNVHEEHKK
ncbi:MAG: hypothetical protein K0S74_1830 [Chlamydiales bacterium]|jgi:hypothetical protein|nr:hypothetical protein [Chlamydiales bacterium]